MKDYQLLQQKYVVNTYPDRHITLIKGDGVYLYDQNNQKYLDMMSNYGVSIFGYNNPHINKFLRNQLKNLVVLHGSFNNNTRALASQKLIEKCKGYYAKVYWANSGTEAIEAALKFAVLATGKKKFISCIGGYHGKTLGSLSATSGEKYKNPFEPLLWQFKQVTFGNEKELEKAIDKDTAAFVVEPVQGESGVIVPPKDYLKKVRDICNKHNILLIIDEIQTGAGRTGDFLASEEVSADILCLGKGLAGGLPVGATIVTQNIANKIPKHIHTSTFGGNPFVCAGVIKTLEILDDRLLNQVKNLGEYFINKLKAIKSDLILQVRGKGLIIGVEVKDKRNALLKFLQDEHVLVIPAGENVVRFLPPFIITKENIDFTVEKFKKCVDSL
ncbi:MAG: aspartate aminotransferase family protein [Candidatus Levybacteria bacterium]|nr:aspartate aminotransferase family protein [Candidatus Levybacteria bacterium]